MTNISQISFEKAAESAAARAAKLAGEYRRLGLSASDAFKRAWQEIKKTQETAENASAALGGDLQASVLRLARSIEKSLERLCSAAEKAFERFSPTAFFTNGAEEASKLGEAAFRVENAFGKAAQAVGNFTDRYAAALGLSENEALIAAANYGDVLTYWASGAQSANLSARLMSAASAYAAKTGRDTAEANLLFAQAISNSETAAAQLGLSISKAALEASRAFEQIANGRPWEALTSYEHSQILTLGLLEQAALRYGTALSDSAAISQSRLRAAVSDLQTTLGAALNNAFAPFTAWLTSAIRTITAIIAAIFNIDTRAMSAAAQAADKQQTAIAKGAENQEKLTNEIKKTVKAQNNLLSGFDEITSLTLSSGIDNLPPITPPVYPKGGELWLDTSAAEAVEELSERIRKELGRLTTWIKETFTTLFKPLCELFDKVFKEGIAPGLELFEGIFKETIDTVSEVWAKYGTPIFEEVMTAVAGVAAIAQSVWDYVLQPVLENLKNTIGELWDEHLQPFVKRFATFAAELALCALDIFNGVIVPISTWFSETFGGTLTAVLNGAVNTFMTFLGGLIDIASGIVRTLQGIIQFVTGVFTGDWERAWEGIKNIFGGIWDGLGALVKTPINMCIDLINGLLSAVVEAVNAIIRTINRISINVPKGVPFIGGTHIGFNLQPVSAPVIPKLAQGAVVPKSREFLAVLGDNRRETEIVSPLSTMKRALLEAMREESAAQQINVELTVDGQTLASVVAAAQRRNGRAIGGAFANAY